MGLLDNLSGLLGGAMGGAGQGQGAQQILGELLSQGRPGASSGVLGGLLGGFGGGGAPQQAGGEGASAGAAPAGGGLAGMLEQLAANGLGEHVSSWLSHNPNLPISAQQIHDALGGEQVQNMARSSGLPVGDFLNQLAAHLPQAASEQAGTDAA